MIKIAYKNIKGKLKCSRFRKRKGERFCMYYTGSHREVESCGGDKCKIRTGAAK